MRGAAVVLGSVLSAGLLAAPMTAAAAPIPAPTPSPPSLSVVGPSSVVFEIAPVGGTPEGSAQLVVLNSGGSEARVRVAAVQIDDPPGDCTAEVVETEPVLVPANAPATVAVTVQTAASCASETGTLVVVSDPASAPVAVRFAFTRTDIGLQYALPVGFAIVAALFLGLGLAARRPTVSEFDLGPAFTFNGSWLTTVSTFTALIGIALTTTGVVDSLLPGIDTDKLLTLNLVFGGLVVVAPVVYAALSRWAWVEDHEEKTHQHRTRGTRWALIIASCTTMAGVAGQLATVAILVEEATLSDRLRAVLALGLLLIAVAVFAYAYRWTASALHRPPDPPPVRVVQGGGEAAVRPVAPPWTTPESGTL